MSLVKYRIKDVATDFDLPVKELMEVVAKFYEKPKSNTRVLTEEELNVVFDYITKTHQIESLEQVFAAQPKKEEKPVEQAPEKPASEEKKAAPKTEQKTAGHVAPAKQQPQKPAEPERRRERRVVDTSAVQVNTNRFDDVDNLVSERVQNFQGGKQKFGKKGQQQNKKDNKFKGNKSKNEEQEKLRRLQMEVARKAPVTVKIPDEITVGELASRMKKTAGEVIKCLMKNGVMAGINQMIDFDTAEYVAVEMGCKVEKEITITIEERIIDDHVDAADELETRAPVVVVMGHVDHGKTSTLDAIRKTSVTAGEAGGITQHIGAYTVEANGQMITFLDTPGHAAFTSMRARGAKSTDIAILVVAADDGIMPQTVESINHAKAAEVPIIVAINKMDKPTANPDKIKEQLTKYDLICEEWGGDTIIVPISAKTGQGLDELLEMVLLTAEVQELKANPNRRAKGTVIEARLDKTRGPIATLLVQNGTLKQGDIIIAGTAVGRVRVMTNDKGRTVKTAGPSVPVEITGLADVPAPGDEFNAVTDERMARELVEQRRQAAKDAAANAMQKVTLDNLFAKMQEGEMKELPLVVKADVQGSAEAVKASLEKISNEEVRVKVIHAGVGAINESDILLASTAGAIIVGFNVRPDAAAAASAQRSNVDMRFYRVIYEAIDEIEAAMKGMLAPQFEEAIIGHAEVRMTYKVSAVGTIAGCMVKDGKVTRDAQVRVLRDNIVIHQGEVGSLQRFKDQAKEVTAGYECGMSILKFNDIKEGDIFECFVMQEIKR
ncbi:MAG: translation initiation factor IF-2 [Ruminococcaceae bacterium]|nr:translation initiation factor IF-2 [Oscillospiraceae bacterium]